MSWNTATKHDSWINPLRPRESQAKPFDCPAGESSQHLKSKLPTPMFTFQDCWLTRVLIQSG